MSADNAIRPPVSVAETRHDADSPSLRDTGLLTAWLPELVYVNRCFERERAIVCDELGRIVRLLSASEVPAGVRVKKLAGRAMLPGLINAHSHAFQRVIRGRTERRNPAHPKDSFWTWREMMYAAAGRLSPDDLYAAARMTFLEMLLGGITAVGEFHYLHRTAEGSLYDDPNLLAQTVIRAARDVGLRICLLRVAYARSGFQKSPDERQARFIEPTAQVFLRHAEMLMRDLGAFYKHDEAWMGVAPHSVRAVPLDYLREVVAYADACNLPVHLHVAEQPAEVEACLREYGLTPVNLLSTEGLLGPRFTTVHAIHLSDEEIRQLSGSRGVCACPTTERNLGDGIVAADRLWQEGVAVSLGTDSQTQIDLLEDARELEYHLRLRRLERAVLSADKHRRGVLLEFPGGEKEDGSNLSELAAQLFECATVNGADSIGAGGEAGGGVLAEGRPADFFTIDLNDPSIAGANRDDLLSVIVFSLSRTAIKDVIVGGRMLVENGAHADQWQIIERFKELQGKLWGS